MRLFLVLVLLFTFPTNAEKRKALSANDKKAIVKVLEANESLHGAFFDYSAKEVEKTAEKTLKALKNLNDSLIASEFVETQKQLNKIKATNSREQNNELYAKASTGFVHVVNTYDVGPNYNSYSCPMVKKKWVQNSTKKRRTHNPYAPEMPHCGYRETDHK